MGYHRNSVVNGWTARNCENKYNYLCKKPDFPMPPNPHSEDEIGKHRCEIDEYAFGRCGKLYYKISYKAYLTFSYEH